MAFAQGSRSGLSYLKETTFGVTPAGNFQSLAYNTHSLNLTKDRVQGNEIQPDRMLRVDRHGNRRVGGDVAVDLRAGDFDELLEGAMFNTWDNSPVGPDILKPGVTPPSFSFEDSANDIGQYRVFTGCTVSSLAVSIAPNQMVTSTFTMVGKDMSISGTGKTNDPTSSNQPFDAYSGDLAIGNVGSPTVQAIVTGIDFTIDNTVNPTFVVGDDSTPQLEFGMASVEGTITAYFQDADLIDRFLNETESEMSVSVNDPSGANLYTFGFPRIKINSADVPVDGTTSRVITMSFVAIYDATMECNFYIERPDTT